MTRDGADSSSALRSLHELELAALVEEFEEARRQDPSSITVESWCQRHPEFAAELAELLPGLLLMESVAHETSETALRRTESEPIPDRIGEYRIKARIGRGGMGIVYLAEQASLGREVALKVLPTNVGLDRGFLERFRREAKAAARLLHPNIVPVFGAGQADDRHFFAMRYIDGCSLDETLREQRSAAKEGQAPEHSGFPLREVVKIVQGVASAVSHAHSKGILHRDIKPGNVLLDREGHAWVTDFGLCRIEDAGQLTSDGAILGTLRYMAPEQIEGVADERSDVYGVGLLLFELLAMRPAFDSVKRAKVVHDVLHTPVIRLRRLRKDIPRSLETIVQKATTKLPEERYQSAEALQRDLEAYLEDRPISARPPSALYLARLFASRHRLATAVALVAALLLGLLGALYVRDLRASRTLSERRAYVGDLAAAEAALREGATQRARFHLDQAPVSLRSWEWAHLDARIDQSVSAVELSSNRLERLTVDPTGTRAAVCTAEGVSVVSLPSLEVVAQIRCGRAWVSAWDTTGKQLYVGLFSGSLHLYGPKGELDGGEFELIGEAPISNDRRRQPRSMVVAGDELIVGLRRGGVIRWAPRTGEVDLVDVLGGEVVAVGLAEEPGQDGAALGHRSDAQFWAASNAGEVAIYQGLNRVRLHRVDHRQAEVNDLYLDPGLLGGVLVTRVGAVLGFDLVNEEEIELFRCPEELRALASDGRLIAAVGTDKLVHLVDRERRSELRALSGNPHPVNGAAFVPGTPMILTIGEDGWLRAFNRDVSGGGIELHGHINDVNAVAFSRDGRRLVTGGREGTVVVWDLERAVPLEVFTDLADWIGVVGIHEVEGVETIYACAVGGEICCWRSTAGANDEPYLSDRPPPTRLRLSRPMSGADLDDRTERVFFATTSGIDCLDLRTLELGSPRADGTQLAAGEPVESVVLYGERLYAMNYSGELLVFDPSTGELLYRRAIGFGSPQSKLSFTDGGVGGGPGPRCVFVSTKNEVVIFDASTGEAKVLFSSRAADGFLGEFAMQAVWIEDGARVLVTTRNGLVSVWDPEDAEHLVDLRGHEYWAMRIERCKATGWIASLSAYGGVRLWNTITTNEWAELAAENPPLERTYASSVSIESIERQGLLDRVLLTGEDHGVVMSASDRMLVGSRFRANAADLEGAALYALVSAEDDPSSESVALLESAAARLPSEHPLRPAVLDALDGLWDVVAWRNGRRGNALLGGPGASPPSARKTMIGAGLVCAPFVLMGSVSVLGPAAKEILWWLRR